MPAALFPVRDVRYHSPLSVSLARIPRLCLCPPEGGWRRSVVTWRARDRALGRSMSLRYAGRRSRPRAGRPPAATRGMENRAVPRCSRGTQSPPRALSRQPLGTIHTGVVVDVRARPRASLLCDAWEFSATSFAAGPAPGDMRSPGPMFRRASPESRGCMEESCRSIDDSLLYGHLCLRRCAPTSRTGWKGRDRARAPPDPGASKRRARSCRIRDPGLPRACPGSSSCVSSSALLGLREDVRVVSAVVRSSFRFRVRSDHPISKEFGYPGTGRTSRRVGPGLVRMFVRLTGHGLSGPGVDNGFGKRGGGGTMCVGAWVGVRAAPLIRDGAWKGTIGGRLVAPPSFDARARVARDGSVAHAHAHVRSRRGHASPPPATGDRSANRAEARSIVPRSVSSPIAPVRCPHRWGVSGTPIGAPGAVDPLEKEMIVHAEP